MADQKKLVAEITSMDEDFTQWYTDVVIKAGLIAYSNIKGFMVYKPAGYALWEAVQKHLDARFKAVGVENGTFPIYQPEERYYKKSTREKVWKMQGEWNRRFNELSGMLDFNFRPKTQRYPYDPLELE